MASDGLVFPFFSKIIKKFQTPTIDCNCSPWHICWQFFELSSLVDMMSIGTLMSFRATCKGRSPLNTGLTQVDKNRQVWYKSSLP
ncbi:high affinity cationic amino acid transporter 1-like [Scylla paramamosain]